MTVVPGKKHRQESLTTLSSHSVFLPNILFCLFVYFLRPSLSGQLPEGWDWSRSEPSLGHRHVGYKYLQMG